QEDFFELECALRDAKAAGEKDDAAAVMACDERFHEMIVQAAGNAYVTEFSGTLMLHIRRIKYHYFHLPAMRQASASQHADILAALRAHDAALAKQRMREHWLRAMRGCLNETIAYLEQNEA
ncbi:MAG: GntR family transcriptional regulator, partial [Oscillospiraceae bacterium]